MYDFHANFIKKQFDAKLLFIDTESLTHEIKSKDVYEECFKKTNICLTLGIFQETRRFMTVKMKWLLAK